jgi:hypothetical protein
MKLVNGKLVITLQMTRPRLSASRKSYVIGSTRGFKQSSIRIKGKPVLFAANAIIKRETRRFSPKQNKKRQAPKKT